MTLTRHLTIPFSLLMLASGCASHSAHSDVPKGAQFIAKQKGGIAFVAPAAGTLYIENSKTGQIVYSTPMAYRDKAVFYPENDRIYFNGNVVKETTLDENVVHRLYFLKG